MNDVVVSSDFLMWLAGIAIAGVNLFIGYVLAGIKENMKTLANADKEIATKVEYHREDLIKNYVTTEDLHAVKVDIIERIDRFEKTMLSIAGRRNIDGKD